MAVHVMVSQQGVSVASCFMPTHVLTLDFRIMRNKVGSVQMFHKVVGLIWPAMSQI